jgi:hypothetical protein
LSDYINIYKWNSTIFSLLYLKVTILKKSNIVMDSVTALFYGTDGLLEGGIVFPFLDLHFIIFGNGNMFLLFNICKYHCP